MRKKEMREEGTARTDVMITLLENTSGMHTRRETPWKSVGLHHSIWAVLWASGVRAWCWGGQS